MSLTAAFHNATSGLTVALKAASVTSSNLANSLTEGYARRDLTISARAIGGVSGAATRREVDMAVLSDLRLATAKATGLTQRSADLDRIERIFGAAEDPNGIGALVTRLETTLIAAAGRPEDPLRRDALGSAVTDLTRKLVSASTEVQTLRRDAETQLQSEVTLLNQRLADLAQINKSLLSSGGKDTSGLQDRRQVLIDQIAAQVPLTTLNLPDGTVALMTPKGQFLLNEVTFPASFHPTGMISANHRAEDGDLQQVTVLGSPLRLEGQGRIGALLMLRDELAPQAQAHLDGLAADLAQRSEAAGLPLFALSPGGTGTAARLQGDPTLLEDRFAADPSQLKQDLTDLLERVQSQAETAFGPQNLAQHSAMITDTLGSAAHAADLARAGAAAEKTALAEIMAQGGVDTDHEMQELLQVEKYFAANAKALQVLDQIHSALLKLG